MLRPAEGGGVADDPTADALPNVPPRGGDGSSGGDVQGVSAFRRSLPDQGPPGWLDGVRAQMQKSSSFQRRDALASIVAHAMPPATGAGGNGAQSVHKAVFRAASSLLVDPGLQVREEAKKTLARLAAACPQGRVWCIKYAGLLLSTAEPVRVRLFLIQTLKLFVSDALVHCGSGELRADSAVGEDARVQRYFWFESARAAAIEALKTYIEAEQAASHCNMFQHAEHGVLIEKTDAADGEPCEVLEAATGRLVWTRARFLKSFFLRVS